MESVIASTNHSTALKSYIINLDQPKPSEIYDVVLENNTDFIIRRHTVKTDRELVLLVSQGLYYIKDKQRKAEPLTEGSLNSFFRELKSEAIELHQVNWLNTISKDTLPRIWQVVSDETLGDMCRHNMLDKIWNAPSWFKPFWRQNSKLFIRLHRILPKLEDKKKYQPCIPVIFWIEQNYGTNEALYFAEKLAQTGIIGFSCTTNNPSYAFEVTHNVSDFVKIMSPEFNVNLRRFIDYLFFDLYSQGYAEVCQSFFHEYYDYLKMQKHFYGKIKEKYPPSFKMAHDVMALKVNLAKAAECCKNFEEHTAQIRPLAYTARGYSIVIPQQSKELAEEGINLSHCVGDYISRVANGECHILFLRRKNAPGESLVTLQLTNNRICQAQGANRRPITQQERKFLLQWGQEKDIQIAV